MPCRNRASRRGASTRCVQQGASHACLVLAALLAIMQSPNLLVAQDATSEQASGAPKAAPDACHEHRDERDLSHLSGALVDSIAVTTRPPARLPLADAISRRLHHRTTPSTILHLLDVPAGATLDTLRLAGGLRALRRQRILADVALDARECDEARHVVLTVRTTDDWSTRGRLTVGRTRMALSLGEENLLGSGRAIHTSVRMDEGRPGFGVQYVEPWLLGRPLTATLAQRVYHGGSEATAMLGTSPSRLMDRWAFLAQGRIAERTTQAPNAGARDQVQRTEGLVELNRRLLTDGDGVLRLGVGAEYASASLRYADAPSLMGPSQVRREFTGVLLSLSRRALAFDRRPLVLGSGRPTDVPRALEFDLLLAAGRDAATQGQVQHLDAWVGRTWSIGTRGLLVGDGWWSGFRKDGAWSAGSARASLLSIVPSGRGGWTTQLSGETLLDPDPDVRPLGVQDPTALLLPTRGLAEGTTLISVERVQALHQLTRSYQLGGALFGAASRRWELAGGPDGGARGVAAIGAGVRLLPTRPGRASLRLDVTLPVAGQPTGWGPSLSFSISPWFEQFRHRDGRRDP